MQEKEQEKLGEALLKVALGFQVTEVTEEFAEVDGQLKLTKRKRTKKDVPPDIKAMQLLLSGRAETDIESMSDQELEEEKLRLIATLKEKKNEKGGGQVCVEKKKSVNTEEKKTRAKPRKRVVRKKEKELTIK
jgi:hypothetical protein